LRRHAEALAEMQRALAGRDGDLQERQKALAQLQELLRQRDADLTWRLTAPIRTVGRLLSKKT
jgi:hypothetical protein